MTRFISNLPVCACFLLTAAITQAQIANTITYQGVLKNAGGSRITGTVALGLNIYAASGGGALYTDTHGSVEVDNGLFTVVIGTGSGGEIDLPFDQPYELGITVNSGPELSPRTLLTAEPYALNACGLNIPGGSNGDVLTNDGTGNGVWGAPGAGSQGPQGKAGAAGAQGPQGKQGDPGPVGSEFWGGSLDGDIHNTNSGNVGIGTTAPSGLFHVQISGTTFSASGGTITYSGGYTIHTFTNDANTGHVANPGIGASNGISPKGSTHTFTPNGPGNVRVLVIGGGGSGGRSGGLNSSLAGGGGGGGFVEKEVHAVTAQTYTVIVGAGGPTDNGHYGAGREGGDSSFDGIIAKGGGGSHAGFNGAQGGSGSGGAHSYEFGGATIQTDSNGGTGYGNAGGRTKRNPDDSQGTGGGGGAGGGGAGPSGSGLPFTDVDANVGQSGHGGAGRASDITGTSVIYAGGGGGAGLYYGGDTSHEPGLGGSGGGGDGGYEGEPAGKAGTHGLGGGGGGASNGGPGPVNIPVPGGSGVVIISYPTPDARDSIVVDSTSGNVGIGMTNPSVALDVMGDIEYTGTLTDVSDERLKENIAPLRNGLDKVLGIEAKYYNMTNTPGRTEIGFIAQNVRQYAPEAISVVDPENGRLGVSYSSLVPVAFEAIKELNDRVKSGLEEQNALRQQQMALQRERNKELHAANEPPQEAGQSQQEIITELRAAHERQQEIITGLHAAHERQQKAMNELKAQSESLKARLLEVEAGMK